VVGAEYRAQLVNPLHPFFDALFIEIVAEDIHAVGAGEVVAPVAIEIADAHIRALLDHGRLP
jgi:hypothetical protein